MKRFISRLFCRHRFVQSRSQPAKLTCVKCRLRRQARQGWGTG